MGARLFRCFIHLQWVSLLFAISPLQFLFFFKRKKTKSKKKKNKTKKQQTASDPLPLGCAILFFLLFFWFLGVLLSWFVVILRDWQKKWQDLTLCHFSPLGIANLFVVVSACFRSLVPLETM